LSDVAVDHGLTKAELGAENKLSALRQ
jgi:hypothetical protein